MRLDDLADDLCPWCGGEIPRCTPHAVKRVYCCIECQRADYRQMEKAARLEAKQGRPPCMRCGKPIAITKDRRARFCSHQCQHDGGTDHRCANCGKPFKGTNRRKYCTIRCAARRRERIRCEATV